MRFFLSCQQSLRKHNVPAYSFWETYFKKGIEEAKYEWVEASEVDWAEGLIYSNTKDLKKWRDRIWTKVIADIKRQHHKKPIDLFLSYLFPKQVESTALKEIQTLGIPCVNFFCDNVREFTAIPKEFHDFDLHWVPEFKALKMYQEANLKHIYAPMPVWIPPEQRTCHHVESYGVSFIGSRDVQRETLLAKVLEAGIEIEIRGAGWSTSPLVSQLQHRNLWRTGINQWEFLAQHGVSPWLRKLQAKSLPKVPDETFTPFVKPQPDAAEYVQIIGKSLITLGINRYPSFHYPFVHPNTYSRMRDIEAPMMGACYLTEWTEGLDNLYELGDEIEIYRTVEELIEKIQVLAKNSEKRKRLRYNGQKRVLADHTIMKSLKQIGDVLGVSL